MYSETCMIADNYFWFFVKILIRAMPATLWLVTAYVALPLCVKSRTCELQERWTPAARQTLCSEANVYHLNHRGWIKS